MDGFDCECGCFCRYEDYWDYEIDEDGVWHYIYICEKCGKEFRTGD